MMCATLSWTCARAGPAQLGPALRLQARQTIRERHNSDWHGAFNTLEGIL